MLQMTLLISGEYLQLPTVVLNLGESASVGTGMMISTLFAVDRRLNWLLALNKQYSINKQLIALHYYSLSNKERWQNNDSPSSLRMWIHFYFLN